MKDLLTENRIIFFILVPFLDLSILIVFGDAAERVPSFSIQLYRNKRINQELLLLLRFQSLFFLLLVFLWGSGRVGLMRQIANLLIGIIRSGGSNPLSSASDPNTHARESVAQISHIWRDRIAGRVHRSRKPEALRSPWVRIPLPPPYAGLAQWQRIGLVIRRLRVRVSYPAPYKGTDSKFLLTARLAQLVERKPSKFKVVGSSPTFCTKSQCLVISPMQCNGSTRGCGPLRSGPTPDLRTNLICPFSSVWTRAVDF